MTVPIPAGVDWDLWRVVASERIAVSLAEVEDRWSLDDLLDAHLVLDMYDELEHRANRAASRR